MKRLFQILLVFAFTISAGIYLYQKRKEVPVEQVFPGKVWAKPIETLPDLKGVGAPTAKNCGACHTEIYAEWKLSTHANALSDIQFQSELAKPSSPKWICLNCHIPIQNQRETMIIALRGGDYFEPIEVTNPNFNPEMKEEAITCATCHVRVDSQTKESYVIGGNGTTSPPHPIKINREFLQNRCYDCHNETYTLNQSLVCAFQTGTEHDGAVSDKSCVSCHLPEVQRSFVKPSLHRPVRSSHRHGFIGGGVPKSFSLYKDQIRLGYRPGIVLKEFKIESDTIIFKIQNQNASHHVTTGDPERFYRFRLEGLDRDGKVLYHNETKIGQDWEWSPIAKKVNDNRIPSGGEFIWKVDLPKDLASVRQFRFQAVHVRLRNQTSDYMKQTALNVPNEFQEKVKNIKEFYPHSSIVIEVLFDADRKTRKDTPIEELFKRNAERRGE